MKLAEMTMEQIAALSAAEIEAIPAGEIFALDDDRIAVLHERALDLGLMIDWEPPLGSE